MKVLVTGASGFVGSALCEELNLRGIEPYCLLRKSSSLANLTSAKFQPVMGDLSSQEALEKIVEDMDVIFHVAGSVAALSLEDFMRSNRDGARNLAQAAAKSAKKLKRFVLVSSLAAAGPSTPERSRVEADQSTPVSHYGMSKLAGEQEVLQVAGKIPVTIVRPPAVYGPRDKGVLTFFQIVNLGILPRLGLDKPDPHRYSFVHVKDLVQGIALAGLKEGIPSGEVFYLSGEGEYSWEEAMGLVAQGMEKKTFSLSLPIALLKVAAFVCTLIGKITGKALPFSLDKIKEIEAPAWTCSSQKAKKLLGYEPYWKLPQGFAQTAKWYRENGWL